MSEKNGEETYSVIFSALKHPVRRKILRMLRVEELTYTQILSNLGIDSGHLNYHLENLGELLAKTEQGKYGLSTFGKAAVELMTGVEETKINRSETERAPLSRHRLTLLLQIITIIAFVIAAITFLNVKYDSTYSFGSSLFPDTHFIAPNASITSTDTINIGWFPTNTFTTRYRVFFKIDIVTNASLLIRVNEILSGAPGPNYQQHVPLIFNETREGPYHSEQGTTLGYTILVPLTPPKEHGYQLDGFTLYDVNITNLGKMSLGTNGTTLTLPNYTASIKLQTSYPYFEETDYPYSYHGVTFMALALVTALLPYLPALTKQIAKRSWSNQFKTESGLKKG